MEIRNDTVVPDEDLWEDPNDLEEPEGYYGQMVTSMDAADFELQFPNSGFLNPMDEINRNLF